MHCMHELNNPYDRFAIELVTLNGETVGQLPKELSRITKFYLDRGASMHVELTSKHFRGSPLVQGGMEIACLVVTRMSSTRRNTKITEKYLTLVKELYAEPKEEQILGCFVDDIVNENNLAGASTPSTENKQMKETPRPKRKQQDIRTLFARKKTNTKNNQDIIEIID